MIANSFFLSFFLSFTATKVKQSTDEQDASGRPPASSIAGSEAQGVASAPAVEARELHIRNSHQPNMASETVSFYASPCQLLYVLLHVCFMC